MRSWRLDEGSTRHVSSSTGRRIVYADGKGAITVTDLRSGRSISLAGAPKDVWDVQVAPDGQHVAAATALGKVLIWRLGRPNRPSQVLVGNRGDINALASAPTVASSLLVQIGQLAFGTRSREHNSS